MKEIKQIIIAYDTAISQQKNVALATVVHIEGSAYRAPGARMLIRDDGSFTGAISGGCLEGDVLRKALMVMTDLRPVLITYDTSDEQGNNSIAVSLGCNGIIRILIEPVDPADDANPVNLLRIVAKEKTPSLLVTFYTPDNKKNELQGTKLLLKENTPANASHQLPVDLSSMQADIKQTFSTRSSAFIQYDNAVYAFCQYIFPNNKLIIAGAGNDAIPLAKMADMLGWDVTVVDGRANYNSSERFPGCQLLTGSAEETGKSLQTDEQTAIVLMSHNFAYDKTLLKAAVNSTAVYIGILGPPNKRDKIFRELNEEGILLTDIQKDRIYGPTGLNIGAETAEEIALSIISEIKAVFAGITSNASLRNHNKTVHNRRIRITDSLTTYSVLILAAGSSKRLGMPKQQLIYNGDTLLRNAVKTALKIGTAATVVVTSAKDADTLSQLNDLDVHTVLNEESSEGMSSSIRAGIQFLQQQYPYIRHTLIMVCDQPYVDAEHLRRLIDKQQISDAPATASLYAGRKGVPAIFHGSLFADLLSLKGDTGAKYLIEQLEEKVATVSFPEGAIDIDTATTYEELVSGQKQREVRYDH